MSKETIDAVGLVLSYYSTPAGTAPLVSTLGNDGSAMDAAVLSLQTLAGAVQMFKSLPNPVSFGVTGLALANDAKNIITSYNDGKIPASVVYLTKGS